MVNPRTKDYGGIYDWRGSRPAQKYLDYLLPILRFFSVKGSVGAERLDRVRLDTYLAEVQKT
jgi:hypothetical protein